jgi:signal transduction histidine kinase
VTVGVGQDNAAGDAVLTVTDTGAGIAPEHLGRVFDRFFKVDAARSRDATGRSGGLGLAICKAIVERHGGTIAAASAPGRGTTFTVRFPGAAHAS